MKTKSFLFGVILGFIIRIMCVEIVDVRYALRDRQCVVENKSPVKCNKWENAPVWEKVLIYQPNFTCMFKIGLFCKE